MNQLKQIYSKYKKKSKDSPTNPEQATQSASPTPPPFPMYPGEIGQEDNTKLIKNAKIVLPPNYLELQNEYNNLTSSHNRVLDDSYQPNPFPHYPLPPQSQHQPQLPPFEYNGAPGVHQNQLNHLISVRPRPLTLFELNEMRFRQINSNPFSY